MKATPSHAPLAILLALATTSSLLPGATPVWFDSFDVSNPGSTNINDEIGTPRQGGPFVPTSWVTNTADPFNDYHHQLWGPLQLAGDGNLLTTLASPDFNFSGSLGGEIVGKQVSVSLDVGLVSAGGPGAFTQGAITIGSSSTLQQAGAGTGFSVVFIEDSFAGNGNFIQIYNNGALIDNLVPNPAGAGIGQITIFADDLVDGDPWNGAGNTVMGVSVNDVPIGSYPVGAGYTANYLTLEGSWAAGTNSLDTHVFDNLTVFSDVVPEPSTTLLFALSALGLLRRRR